MRSVPVKQETKPIRSANKKTAVIKKRKTNDLNVSSVRDTVSETISFVIKGKLTPIKPILSTVDFVNKKKVNNFKLNSRKTVKDNNSSKKLNVSEEATTKKIPKVQRKTAKTLSAHKRKSDKVILNIDKANSSQLKPENGAKIVKSKQPKTRTEVKPQKIIKKSITKGKQPLKRILKKNKITPVLSIDEDEIKKQQTIEKLLKEVNEEIKTRKSKVSKHKSNKPKKRKEIDNKDLLPSEIPLLTGDPVVDKIIKLEVIEDTTIKNEQIESNNIKFDENINIKQEIFDEKDNVEKEVPEIKKKIYRKLKSPPKVTVIKKRVPVKGKNNKSSNNASYKTKTKLFKFWNGPKRHRVASLNAIAKVHCLYENETRGNLIDGFDEATKVAYTSKINNKNKNNTNITIKNEDTAGSSRSSSGSPPPTRTLRSVPGLRGLGKHWDMHDTTSSDDDDLNIHKYPIKIVKKEKLSQPKPKTKPNNQSTEKKRRSTEMVMDLKDMVVRKRMASLNASAILAASYSAEKRPNRSKDASDDSSSCASNSSDEYFAALDKHIKEEVIDDKKEDENKLIEVHTNPNKKVAVILNQDTDVTITGVYVNSTTRSTHHEGYCSIAGMQYRISATSHTQTAATAVSTETLLQPSSSSGPDNSNSDSMPSSKSYTPLDALSNMQPPPGPGIQHNHPVMHGQQQMGPPQHVLPLPPHQVSPGLHHSCSSAFSSPHSNPNYHQGEAGYVHAGYYQPAGPLITVPPPHSHGQGPPLPPPTQQQPAKTITLSEASPTLSTTPSLSSHEIPPPPPSSTGADSSDSEVIITSVTAPKDNIPSQVHPPGPTYRYAQYSGYPYPYPHPHPYPYPSPAPPPNPSYSHHDICFSPNPYGHKWTFRRHLTGTQYYPPQDMYPIPPPGPSQQSQQMVTSTPVSSSGATFSSAPGAPPPPTALIETYPGPQATLVESYQPPPPPPPHYYPSPAYGPPAPCYSHPPSRPIPYISTYQSSCPCPMQSCPKNGLTGPLTGDSKRSNLSSISKDSMPLPPVALALPLEPASATGPPSPARGSAGMPPPPSPAGATYQALPLPTKQESHSSSSDDDCKLEKKRKARIGKAMVRNKIAASIQQNTMLLMCNPSQTYVKREIESPKDTELDEKQPEEETKPLEICNTKDDTQKEPEISLSVELKEETASDEPKEIHSPTKQPEITVEPIVSTVAENVKVKNMKRKLSLSTEKVLDTSPSSPKRQKIGSYKFLIKKETNAVRINNGKRKLLGEMSPTTTKPRKIQNKHRKPTTKRKIIIKQEPVTRRKLSIERGRSKLIPEKNTRKVNSKHHSPTAPAVLDKLFAKNNVERIIESVISDACLRTPHENCVNNKLNNKDSGAVPNINNNNNKKTINKPGLNKIVKNETKKMCTRRRKSKSNEVEVVAAQSVKVIKKPLLLPKWSNGWMWEGEPFEAKVFLNSDELTVIRKCYPAMRHDGGDKIVPKDCVLLKAGPRKNDLPFVAKIAALWENPDDGEMMMSLLWYYRPEHTEQGRQPADQPDEVFASRHKDSNSVACIDDKCYVLTFNEYCRYRKTSKRIESGVEEALPCIPNPEPYPRSHRQPPKTLMSPEMVFFCRRVYDFRQKRIIKNPT